MTTGERPYSEGVVLVAGGGPAGLTAAYELARHGVKVVVAEQESFPGGIARTVTHRGYRFDIGGHRFFTKHPLVEELWHELLGEDFLLRPRSSRIFCRNTFFDYPLKPGNVLSGLGIGESLAILASYLRRKVAPIRPEETLADWVTNRFGDRLFELFFRSYTEKVWGVSCREIGAQWAAQRIQGLSLRTAVANMLRRPGTIEDGEPVRTLIGAFHYPRLGPGMMWEALCREIVRHGGEVRFNTRVGRIVVEEGRVAGADLEGPDGKEFLPVGHLVSTMPLSRLVKELDPPPGGEVAAAASSLRYRDFLTVALIVERENLFPDTWIYIHEESLKVGRIQNFGNWSPELIPERGTSCLGMEYFCFEGDPLWSASDEELVALATRELEATGLVPAGVVREGVVVRVPKAYPMYDDGYLDRVAVIREYLAGVRNLQVIGRNGMHRYNNMDHSMLTGLLAARNILGERHDLWDVNADDDYHEEEASPRPPQNRREHI
ncbi:NAD(P)/FAD-dependent oxidoreductase [Geomonas sp. Red32]|uniref:NAD(P)/FAD-dependent oxidoreductase n=1 Tax=Geomonas sp. Red32 TaxID=2912856 RepID=UPI00202CBD82|nr:NAD(P)/FAD-dependent oxidoreductase [Geomonas sp. Red32]